MLRLFQAGVIAASIQCVAIVVLSPLVILYLQHQIEDLKVPNPDTMTLNTTSLLRLVYLAIAIGLALLFGLSGINLAVVAISASVPAASNSYILAKQLGGDARLMAQILTLQTIVAAATMPLIIALVA